MQREAAITLDRGIARLPRPVGTGDSLAKR